MGDKRIRPPCFKLEVPGDVDAKLHLYERLQKVREHLNDERNRPPLVNNYDILDYLLSCFQLQEKQGKESVGTYSIIGREVKLNKNFKLLKWYGRIANRILKVDQTERHNITALAGNSLQSAKVREIRSGYPRSEIILA